MSDEFYVCKCGFRTCAPMLWVEHKNKCPMKKLTKEQEDFLMKPIKKTLIGLNKKGELDIIETDEDEEGMFQL